MDVLFSAIEILLRDNVGILLTNNNAIITVKYGVHLIISKFKFNSASSKIKGVSIKSPPAGEGIPSKKLFFQSCSLSFFVKLNLASLRTQQTENISAIAHPNLP